MCAMFGQEEHMPHVAGSMMMGPDLVAAVWPGPSSPLRFPAYPKVASLKYCYRSPWLHRFVSCSVQMDRIQSVNLDDGRAWDRNSSRWLIIVRSVPAVGRDRLSEVLEDTSASASAQVLGFRTMKHKAHACAVKQCCRHEGVKIAGC